MGTRFVDRDHVRDVAGAVVVVDVLRAFTTAAYAFAAGADRIVLVGEVDEALDLKRAGPDWLAMGENGGRRIDGFDLSNSPVEASRADLAGRTIVQRTGAGTRGVVNAPQAGRMWCASLVCASVTARAVRDAGLGPPTYLITGDFPSEPQYNGEDDRLNARLIEHARTGESLDAAGTAHAVATSDEATRTLASAKAMSIPPTSTTPPGWTTSTSPWKQPARTSSRCGGSRRAPATRGAAGDERPPASSPTTHPFPRRERQPEVTGDQIGHCA